ncbi:MAG: PEP-CTERM sorting domain-containing protein [Candidatus Omnitrophota bacterium]
MRYSNLLKRLYSFFIAAALLMIAASAAHAYIPDGDLSDWGVTPFVDWVPDSVTADYKLGDDTWRNYTDAAIKGASWWKEAHDIEALYFDDFYCPLDGTHYLSFALVTSNRYANTWASEDMGISLDGNAHYEYALDVQSSAVNTLVQSPVYSVNNTPATYTPDVLYVDTVNGPVPINHYNYRGWDYLLRSQDGLPDRYFPFNVFSGTTIGQYELYKKYYDDIEPGGELDPANGNFLNRTWVIEGRIDASLFGDFDCGDPVKLYMSRVTCLKDWVVLNGTINGTCPIPEPSTLILFGSGLVAIVRARARKKI